MNLEIPVDALCQFELDGKMCRHPYSSHAEYANCSVCDECDFPITLASPGGNFHAFVLPPRLAGGAFTPEQERQKYDEAMGRAK